MSIPGGVREDQLPRYAGAIAGRQLILSSFQFLHASARSQPTITGRWDGRGVSLDMNEDGTFVSMLHTAPGRYSKRAAGSYKVTSTGVILRYTWPSERTQTCSDFRLFHDEPSGADILVLCRVEYRK